MGVDAGTRQVRMLTRGTIKDEAIDLEGEDDMEVARIQLKPVELGMHTNLFESMRLMSGGTPSWGPY
jgi:hypothetical protein